MPLKQRSRSRTHRSVIGFALAALIAALGLTALTSPAFASTGTGSVYYNSNLNVAAGAGQLFNGSFTGLINSGLGYDVMTNLTTGGRNVGIGYAALGSTTTGNDNAASGTDALIYNTAGNDNVASGALALLSNTTGNDNVATGFQALHKNKTGSFNLALGSNAGASLTSGSHNIDLVNAGVAGESGKIRIGTKGKQTAAFLQGVSGKSIPGPVKTVVINANGQLGTKPPSAKHKQAGGDLSAKVTRLSRQLRRQAKEIRQLRREAFARH